jgi:hypothetical protein
VPPFCLVETHTFNQSSPANAFYQISRVFQSQRHLAITGTPLCRSNTKRCYKRAWILAKRGIDLLEATRPVWVHLCRLIPPLKQLRPVPDRSARMVQEVTYHPPLASQSLTPVFLQQPWNPSRFVRWPKGRMEPIENLNSWSSEPYPCISAKIVKGTDHSLRSLHFSFAIVRVWLGQRL